MSGRSETVIKVPLARTLGESIRRVFGDLKYVGRIGWRPFVVLILFSTGEELSFRSGLESPLLSGGAAGSAVLVQAICCTAFMVSWYRHLLEAPGTGFWRAFWRVLGYYALSVVGIYISMVVVAFLMGIGLSAWIFLDRISVTPATATQLGQSIGYAGSIVGAVVSSLLLTRISLIFPASASGHSMGFLQAWQKMYGNTWRLTVAFTLVTIPFFALAFGSTFAFKASSSTALMADLGVQSIVLNIVIGTVLWLILFLFLALTTSVSAIFYRELVQHPTDVAEVFA
jgi:hypothetical protein